MSKAVIRELVDEIVYGPVNSRRFGKSLGINLSGNGKYCSFGCPYCFRGYNDGRPNREQFLQSLPQIEQVMDELQQYMEQNPHQPIEDWTIAGNAEPTDHPQFSQIVEQVLQLRDQKWPHIVVSILSNGMGLIPRVNNDHQQTRRILSQVDRPCIKLDAAIAETWKRIEAPAYQVTLEEWLECVQGLDNFILQTMLLCGRIDNTTEAEINALAKCYRQLSPKAVHLYTINKNPADSRLLPVATQDMQRIVAKLRKQLIDTNIEILAY